MKRPPAALPAPGAHGRAAVAHEGGTASTKARRARMHMTNAKDVLRMGPRRASALESEMHAGHSRRRAV